MRILGQYTTAQTALACAHEPVTSLYIHVPFCFHKCHYCDFYSVVTDKSRHEQYLTALERELATLAPHAGRLATVFIGGGTPTLLAPALWRRLFAALHARFDTSTLSKTGEFTVECNPETASADLLEALVDNGVTRLSVGAQSFNPHHLKTLERWHDPLSVERALRSARGAGLARLSIDLIFGIPGQTLADWLQDLRIACALAPEIGHISGYSLTIEPGTALAERIRLGEIPPPDEELQAAMYEATINHLRAQGFSRYEVSNFARTGAGGGPSAHNLAYWRQQSWLAAGPSAASHVRTNEGGWRWRNAPRLTDWADHVLETGYAPVVEEEAPDAARLARETLMTGVRLAEGVDLGGPDISASGRSTIDALRREGARCCARGLATVEGGRFRLTDRGFLHADSIAADLMACVPGAP